MRECDFAGTGVEIDIDSDVDVEVAESEADADADESERGFDLARVCLGADFEAGADSGKPESGFGVACVVVLVFACGRVRGLGSGSDRAGELAGRSTCVSCADTAICGLVCGSALGLACLCERE